MLSYRHIFHAGNHADVLKHNILILTLNYLIKKNKPLTLIDTHSGAGFYNLNHYYVKKSEEYKTGFLKILENKESLNKTLIDYLDLIKSFNNTQDEKIKIYPGSSAIMNKLKRFDDKLKLFELNPTDFELLSNNFNHKNIEVLNENSFKHIKKFLPPLSRRGLIFCDPSYELKSDYQDVLIMLEESLLRFATGVYLIWYPILSSKNSFDLPIKMKKLTNKFNRNFLNINLNIGFKSELIDQLNKEKSKLTASGVFIINPPYILEDNLKETLPILVNLLKQNNNASYLIESK